VEVTPLHPAEVQRMRADAIGAIEEAVDLAAMKRVRLAHQGDSPPLSLRTRESGSLPPQARKDAGLRVGEARADVNRALHERQAILEHADEARVLGGEAGGGQLPGGR